MLDADLALPSIAPMTPAFRRLPVPNYGFELIEARDPESRVLDLTDTASLYEDLAHSGALIFRGFADSLEDFSELVTRHSSRVTFDPARKAATRATAEINAGRYAMGLHRENGNLPFNPDLQWFFCLEPAKTGSQTTLCDGSRVLFEMAAPVRRAFERRNIRYARRLPWANVRRFLGIELGVPEDEVTDEHLAYVNEHVPGQTYRRLDADLIASEFVTSAITTSVFSGRKAFCNSMLGPSINYEPPRISWEDGSDIDFALWDEIRDVTERYTYDIDWQRGDIVMVDNSRLMHGRRHLDDPGRRIFGAQSYRKEAVQ